MPAPVIHSRNDFQVADDNDHSVNFALTNAPQTGGVIVCCAALYGGGGTGATSLAATGGSGISINERASTMGTGPDVIGVVIWSVEYSTAPTSLTISRAVGGANMFISGSALNITGQNASYFDVAGTGGATDTAPAVTSMGNTTDATDLVIGVATRSSANAVTIAPATNWTQVVEIDESNATYQTCSIIERAPGATGAYPPTWVLSSSDTWSAAGVAIKGTSGGSTQAPRSMHQFRQRR